MEESLFRMRNSLFLDTSYAIAISVIDDEHNQEALELAQRIESEHISLITTQAILLEIGNSLSKKIFRNGAVSLLDSILRDEQIEIISLTQSLFDRSFELFRNRTDKEWGLVDCISFVVMRERGINDALTADEHFVQAGFRALLREN